MSALKTEINVVFRVVLFSLFLILIFLRPNLVMAQASELCAPLDGTITALEARVLCLEEQIDALRASQKVLEGTILNIFGALEEQGTEMRGPERMVEAIPAGNPAVIIDRSGAVHECLPPAAARDGYTIFGAELDPQIQVSQSCRSIDAGDSIVRRCTGNYADFQQVLQSECGLAGCRMGGGEVSCSIQFRNRGCYVNSAWFEWIQRQPSASLTYETVCE